MKYTVLILFVAASAATAIAQTPSSTASTAAAAAKKTPATATAAKSASATADKTPEPPKPYVDPNLPPAEDSEGNPIYYTNAPVRAADVQCDESGKDCVLKLPPGIPPTTAPLKDAFSLRYIDIKEGTGAVALPGWKYTIQYTGWNAKSGIKFDSTYDHHQPLKDKNGKVETDANGKYKLSTEPEPFSFTEGEGRIIPGLDLGVMGMRVGGKRRIIIPYQLAYGIRGRSLPNGRPGVTPRSDIIFDVDLLDVSNPNAPAPKKPEEKSGPKPGATTPGMPAPTPSATTPTPSATTPAATTPTPPK